MGIATAPDQIPIPRSREQIRPYLAARYPFLFDWGGEMTMASQSHQSANVRDAYLHVTGWAFEDVEAVYLWAWDNHRHGGRGKPAFERFWIRDLEGFCALYPDDSPRPFRSNEAFDKLSDRVKSSPSLPINLIRYVAEDLFELERGMDCLTGLDNVRETQKRTRRQNRTRLFASVSPMLLSIARTHPHILTHADHEQHADLAAKTSDSLPIASRSIEPDKERIEARVVGWDDLQYILHLFSEIGHRKVANFGYHAGSVEHDALRSKIFRLAINFVAHHDPGRAATHLAKRLSEENHGYASCEVERRKAKGWSVFDCPPDTGTTATADAGGEPLAAVLDHYFVGASYVESFRSDTKRLSNEGLFDPARNPAVKAFFFPDAWTQSSPIPALLAARDDWHDELAVLDQRYVLEDRKRHIETSAIFASRLSECIIAPFTLRDFGVKLPDSSANPPAGKKPPSNKQAKFPACIESGAEKAQKSAVSIQNSRTRQRSKLLLNHA
ncbi:hypothetical protein MKP08_11580 [Erythrobacter sp. LQ02-29]|uniref:hypothetical protein n=1 Tax=Erythrobacter sp. LQ02-29 TaxID=2920384 RepID=UPI001F4E08A9|nr:hypothetical protein [Erythrobacter sp. LQ02-29]MCP9223391.1 hypothetical protein [Erythrobacter sp. LQ02-29]